MFITFLIDGGVSAGGDAGAAEAKASFRITGSSAASSSSSLQVSHFPWIVFELFAEFDVGFMSPTDIRITRSATWSASISAASFGCEILNSPDFA